MVKAFRLRLAGEWCPLPTGHVKIYTPVSIRLVHREVSRACHDYMIIVSYAC